MILYRKLTESDIPAVITLLLEMHSESEVYKSWEPDTAYAKDMCELALTIDGFSVVALDENEIIGVMLGYKSRIPYTRTTSVNESVVYVSKLYRANNIGLKMLKEFEIWGRKSKVDVVITCVSSGIFSERTENLYRALDFEPAGQNFIKRLY